MIWLLFLWLCSCPGIWAPGKHVGLLKDMIQTVPDPAAHIKVSFLFIVSPQMFGEP